MDMVMQMVICGVSVLLWWSAEDRTSAVVGLNEGKMTIFRLRRPTALPFSSVGDSIGDLSVGTQASTLRKA